MIKSFFRFLLLLGIFVFSPACFVAEEKQLTEAEKNALIEQRTREQLEKIIPQMEANCQKNFDKYVHKVVDSLVNAHLDSMKYQ